MKYIVELEPGLFLRYGPIVRHIRTSQQRKAAMFDSKEEASAAIEMARVERDGECPLDNSPAFPDAKIVEIDECPA